MEKRKVNCFIRKPFNNNTLYTTHEVFFLLHNIVLYGLFDVFYLLKPCSEKRENVFRNFIAVFNVRD